jgi:hypothetical protein
MSTFHFCYNLLICGVLDEADAVIYSPLNIQ